MSRRRQLDAAGDAPVVWTVAEPGAAAVMRRILARAEIDGITIIHVPMGAAP
ncbi:hypothetical protein [Jannaschia sp. R86511]|uniref:hypothetical protein n=1 Tax=Jannaschia sp. R86511 TaxID=3093853 RepID=UPI0036D34934